MNARQPRSGLTEEAFGTRFEACYRSLWVVAAAVLGTREGAEDAVQDAAEIGLRKRTGFDPSTDFCAWMSQIVRNVARNAIRKRFRRRAVPIESDVLPAPTGDAEGPGASTHGELLPGSEAFDDRVRAALLELSEDARSCLLLRSVKGSSYEQISRLLGIPKGTAMSHVHRARTRLRDILEAAGDEDAPVNPSGAESGLEVGHG